MKKFFVVVLVLFSILGFVGCDTNQNDDYLRIHIRANSNSDEDQGIKLVVRDNIIEYITPLIADCNNCEQVKSTLNNNIDNIVCIANKVLESSQFDYCARARICNEYFPSRSYDGQVYPADYYDALIIELGSGQGDNWWCVAYPPLCFVGESGQGIQYRSKLVDMIKKKFI